jgi:hypothetical protein
MGCGASGAIADGPYCEEEEEEEEGNNKHTQHLILVAIPLQQYLRENACVSYITYIVCSAIYCENDTQ